MSVIQALSLNESGLGQVRNLAGFKRYLKAGGRVKLVKHFRTDPNTGDRVDISRMHRMLNVVRFPKIVQTKSVGFVPDDDRDARASWLDLDKASEWSFNGNLATSDDGYFMLVYELIDA